MQITQYYELSYNHLLSSVMFAVPQDSQDTLMILPGARQLRTEICQRVSALLFSLLGMKFFQPGQHAMTFSPACHLSPVVSAVLEKLSTEIVWLYVVE